MRRRTLHLTALLVSLGVLLPASALGKTYEVDACNYAEGINHSWVWNSTDPSSDDHYAKHESCPYRLGGSGGTTDQESGLATTDTLGLPDGAPTGTSAGFTFTAAEGTTIAGITDERYLGQVNDSINDWVPALRADGTIIADETCLDTIENNETCYVGAPPGRGTEPATIAGLSAHQLTFGLACTAPAGEECITGATEHKAWAAMYGAKVLINDPTPPTLGPPTGTLWEPAAYHKGTQAVTVDASDEGGGLKSITLESEGKTLASYTASCDYTYPKPCPTNSGEQTLSLPTTELADGTHTLTLTATDAAGNQTSTSTQITVANKPPPAPTELTATSAAGSDVFTVMWRDLTNQTAPITSATIEVCRADEETNCTTPTSAPAEGPATITVPGNGTWTIHVWLTNAAGNSNPTADSARLTVVVGQTLPTTSLYEPPDPALSPNSPQTLASATAQPSTTSRPPKPPQRLKLTATLLRHTLIVHVTGADGRVEVLYHVSEHNHHVLTRRKTTRTAGKATITFQLDLGQQSYTTIAVIARCSTGQRATTLYAQRRNPPRHR